MRSLISAVLVAVCAMPALAQDKSVKLPVTADCGLTSVRDKMRTSNGAGPTTPIRQNQNWSGFENKDLLMNFDVKPIAGWTVTKAVLHVFVAKEDLYGVGLMTVLAPWEEGGAVNGVELAGSPCWNFRKTPKAGDKPGPDNFWSWPGSNVDSVCWSHPAALFSHAGPGRLEKETYTFAGSATKDSAVPPMKFTHLKIPVDPALVEVLAAGLCHGWVMTDDKGQVAESYSLLGPGYPYLDNDAADPMVFTKDIQEPTLRPYLEVWGEAKDKTPPAAPKDAKVVSTSAADGSVVVEFTAPGDDGDKGEAVIGYEAQASNKQAYDADPSKLPAHVPFDPRNLPRWAMPKPVKPGEKQRMPVFSLPPGTYGHFAIRAVDKAGNRGPAATLIVTIPEKPKADLAAGSAPGAPPGKRPGLDKSVLTLSAVPDMVKVDPVTGAVLRAGDVYAADEKYLAGSGGNPISDGMTRAYLTAAANEVAAFQLIVGQGKAPLTHVKIAAADLAGPDGKKIGKENIQLFRVWYVNAQRPQQEEVGPGGLDDTKERPGNWYGDACLPLAAPFEQSFAVPAADNKVPDQKYQAVWVDVYVPRGASAGRYAGELTLSCDQLKTATFEVSVQVLPLALPDKPSFPLELNRYNSVAEYTGVDGAKDPKGADRAVQDYYAMAQQHRCVVNAVPYGHMGRVQADLVPVLKGEGTAARVADWTAFDQRYGPLLDGSHFSEKNGYVGPGAGMPIGKMYLPFHEAWPMPINAQTYKFWKPVSNRLDFAEYAKQAGRVAEGFTKEYQDGFVEVARQTFEHFKEKGWKNTAFEFFGNNKYYYKAGYFSEAGAQGGVSFWLFDECSDFDDYDANALLMTLGRRGVQAAGAEGQVKVLYRVDISQPDMTRGLWNDVVNCWYVGGLVRFATNAHARARWMPGEEHWNYGGGAGITSASAVTEQTILSNWCMGAAGMMPYWSNFGGTGQGWQKGDDLAIFYSGRNYANSGKSYPGPIAGVRMKVLRRVQQDLEYLHLLAAKPGWDRARVRLAVAAYADDPAAPVLSFEKLSLEKLDEIRRRVAATVMEK